MRPRATLASLKVLCTTPFTVLRSWETWRRRCKWNRSWSRGLTLASLEMAQGQFLVHLFHLFLFLSQECVEMISAHKTFPNLMSSWLRLNHPVSFGSPSALAKASSLLSSKTSCQKSAVCTGNLSTGWDLSCIGKEKMCTQPPQGIHTSCWCNALFRRDAKPHELKHLPYRDISRCICTSTWQLLSTYRLRHWCGNWISG